MRQGAGSYPQAAVIGAAAVATIVIAIALIIAITVTGAVFQATAGIAATVVEAMVAQLLACDLAVTSLEAERFHRR